LAREAGVDLNGAPLEVAATPGEERRAVVRAVPERDPDPAHERTSFHPPPPWRGGYGGGAVGLPKLPEWDAVATVEGMEATAEKAVFVALPNGDLVIEDGPDDVQPLANAVEQELSPPYRAEAVRRGDGFWAVGAKRIEVIELPGVDGDEIELTDRGGHRTLLVDGHRGFGTVPALERADTVVRASRIDGDAWEVSFDPL